MKTESSNEKGYREMNILLFLALFICSLVVIFALLIGLPIVVAMLLAELFPAYTSDYLNSESEWAVIFRNTQKLIKRYQIVIIILCCVIGASSGLITKFIG